MVVRLLSPIAEAAVAPRQEIARRTTSPGPYRLGFVDNSRPGSDVLLRRIEESIAREVGITESVHRRKTESGTTMPFLEDFAGLDGVVLGIAEIGGSLYGTAADAIALEQRGVPVALVCSADVADACRLLLARHGMPGIPLVEIPDTAEVDQKTLLAVADGAVRPVLRALTGDAGQLTMEAQALVARAEAAERQAYGPSELEIADRAIELNRINDLLYQLGWTDGLPVLLPTDSAVAEMLAYTDLDPDFCLGLIPPRQGIATVRMVAVNAVMAGCPPNLFPLVIAATRAVLEPSFRLGSLQTTTNPCSPLVIVNGPAARAVGMNSASNAFGQGNRANATLGRALRLVLVNIGGARPGIEDRAVQGTPGKFSFCVAESEERSPWEPLHVERGFDAATSTVTVIGAESQHNINDHVHTSAEGLLFTIADAMSTVATNNIYKHRAEVVLALAPFHAKVLAAAGLSKDDVKRELHKRARRPIRDLKRGGQWGLTAWDPSINVNDDAALVPVVGAASDILVVVVGGAGKHSSFIPTFGATRAATVAVTNVPARPAA